MITESLKFRLFERLGLYRHLIVYVLVKDLRNHGTEKFKSFLLNEMISSSHGTRAISLMLRKCKEIVREKISCASHTLKRFVNI